MTLINSRALAPGWIQPSSEKNISYNHGHDDDLF